MDFFGIGPLEIILILIVGLLVFGPQKLPQISRDLGKAFRSFKNASANLTAEIEKEANAVKEEVKDIKSEKDLVNAKKEQGSFTKELEIINAKKEPNTKKTGETIIEADNQLKAGNH